jgi:prepilin-type N-terminal cleavage/methylation domain-containing protein
MYFKNLLKQTNCKNCLLQSGFTLIELTIVSVVLIVLAAIAIPTFVNLSGEASLAQMQSVAGSLRASISNTKALWALNGFPADGVATNIGGIPIEFTNGYITDISNSSHVPSGVPQRTRQSAKLWYYLLQQRPTHIDVNDTSSTGWTMLLTSECSGSGRRCWEFKLNGSRVGRVIYVYATGSVFVVET